MTNKTQKQLIDAVSAYADSHRMLDCTDIIVGYSGGADSSLLLYTLAGIARERGIRLYAVHINHMLRGADADRDERFCRETCARMGIRFFSERVNIRELARERGQSEEECAREVRYASFSDIRERISGERALARVHVATAHNATDNTETVMFNITRGTAIAGVCGIPPVRDGYIIRPILTLSKEQVLAYCAELGIDYVTDATNAETEYTRNRIRHNILPELREINPALESAVMRMTESLRRDAEYLDRRAETAYRSMSGAVTLDALLTLDECIRSRVLCRFLEDKGAGYENTHIRSALSLCERGGDFSLSLIGRVRLVHRDGVLDVLPDTRERADEPREWEIALREGANDLPEGGCIFVFSDPREIETIKKQNVYNLFIQQTLRGDTINNVFCARSRREGDIILSGGHRHKLKKLYSDKKIPRSERSSIPVVERDGEVVWIPSVRCADGEESGDVRLFFVYCI